MSVPMIELTDKIVIDTGEVVYKHKGLVQKILTEQPLDGLLCLENSETKRIHSSGTPIRLWSPGELEGPSESTWEWNIPNDYKELDIVEKLAEIYVSKDFPEHYMNRFLRELELLRERRMEEFFQTILYVMDTIRKNNQPVGVGRGSCCASFLLFLIGVHRVDPVLYDIPEEEFFK